MENLFQGRAVRLRPFEPDDLPALAGYLNHPELEGRRCLPWGFPEVAPLSRRQIQGIYERWAGEEKGLPLAVLQAEGDRLIGHAECGWDWDPHAPSVSVTIDPSHQRQGFGSDAFRLLLRYLFENTVAHSVSCWIADWNEPALAFVQCHGFRLNGRMRRAGLRRGRAYDVVLTDILRPEWEERERLAPSAPRPLTAEGGLDAA